MKKHQAGRRSKSLPRFRKNQNIVWTLDLSTRIFRHRASVILSGFFAFLRSFKKSPSWQQPVGTPTGNLVHPFPSRVGICRPIAFKTCPHTTTEEVVVGLWTRRGIAALTKSAFIAFLLLLSTPNDPLCNLGHLMKEAMKLFISRQLMSDLTSASSETAVNYFRRRDHSRY